MNVVLMAGGGGTRLWPLSRRNNPKQFIDLGTGKTLLEHTYERACAVAQPADIFVATIEEYGSRIKELLPRLPETNIFYEPERRDTAPAFAAVAVQLRLRGRGKQPAIFMWSDHVFTAEQQFIEDLRKIPALLEENPHMVVIMGHRPTFPETGLGYIEAGQYIAGHDDVFSVTSFKEKPDRATAERYLVAGNFFWNMGSISLTPSYLLEQLRRFEPELMKHIDEFESSLKSNDTAAARAAYAQTKKISIDYALLERTSPIVVVTGDYGWSDVGNWVAVREVFGTKGDHMPRGHHVHVDSKNNYIYNTTDKAVSLIGMDNTIVVVTDDAVLISAKENSHQVKEVVTKLEEAGKTQYL